VMVGSNVGTSLTSGNENTFYGANAANSLATGAENVVIGYNAGIAYTAGESSNIVIGSIGVGGESNTLHIGDGTGSGTKQLNQCFISGIDGINVGSVATVVTESGDQLGTAVITAGTGITVTPGANTITIASSGLSSLAYTNVNSSPYVVLTTDDYLSVDSSGGAITVQLANAATLGKTFIIKDRTGSAATHNITVTTVGGAVNIDGATSFVMNTAFEAISVIGNGSSYEIY
jgi:trimeric autotransporter adhesin